jgi:hypothetical protein
MSSKEARQLPLLIVHLTTVGVVPSPAVTPVIVVVGEAGLVITPGPLCMVQRPVPTTAVLAVIAKVLVAHWFISTPASATVGVALLVNVTSEKLGAQTPLAIVHLNVTLNPAVRPVTVALNKFSSPTVIEAPLAAPGIVQVPTPETGLLPASVKLPLLHCS